MQADGLPVVSSFRFNEAIEKLEPSQKINSRRRLDLSLAPGVASDCIFSGPKVRMYINWHDNAQKIFGLAEAQNGDPQLARPLGSSTV